MKTGLLLSGGMDSVAIAYWMRPSVAFTVDYGQRPAEGEIRASQAIAEKLGIEHHVLRIDMSSLGSGDLSSEKALSIAPAPEWWPFRNQALITFAAMKAVTLGVSELLIGALRTDQFHVDSRADFVRQMDRLLRMQEGGLRLSAPAIELTAAELVKASKTPMSHLAWAHSCHVDQYACGWCRGCRKHYETLDELGYDAY